MMRVVLSVVLTVASSALALAQGAPGGAKPDYPTAAQALEALRAKPGVNVSVQSGWTVIEDRATLSVWSFTPADHRAHPAAIQRKIVQEGANIYVRMNVLCEAPKPDCDALVADFGKLNERVRDDLAPKSR